MNSAVLVGQNFSGRSDWLSARRPAGSWPKVASVGPYPESSFSGFAWRVQEELAVIRGRRFLEAAAPYDPERLGLRELFDRPLHTLSGGELVRASLAVSLELGPDEMHIDTALEQLDAHWREIVMSMITARGQDDDLSLFVVDNRLTDSDIARFDSRMDFDGAQGLGAADEATKLVSGAAAALEIGIRDLSFRYTREQPDVFSNASITLEPGSIHFLVGPNGSGKTTFVKLLAGTREPRAGTITFGDVLFRPSRARERHVALSFQNPDHEWTTLRVEDEIRKRTGEAHGSAIFLHHLGLPAEIANRNPVDLPFVMKKRLSVGLAVASGKPWIVFDEPTLGQDAEFRQTLSDMMHALLKGGAGIAVITHDAEFRKYFEAYNALIFGQDHKIHRERGS